MSTNLSVKVITGLVLIGLAGIPACAGKKLRPTERQKQKQVSEKDAHSEPEEWETTLRQLAPVGLAKTRWPHGVDYKIVRKVLTVEDLPALYQALEDKNMRPYWHRVAELIAYVSNRPNNESAEALLRYARRSDEWWALPEKRQWIALMGKVRALSWVGLVGDVEKYGGLLREALNREGAIEFAAQWKGEVPNDLVDSIQGRAALGLLYAGGPENLKLIDEAYENAKRNYQTMRGSLVNELVSAMAIKAFVQEHGLESWLELQGDHMMFTTLSPYVRRYEPWRKNADIVTP